MMEFRCAIVCQAHTPAGSMKLPDHLVDMLVSAFCASDAHWKVGLDMCQIMTAHKLTCPSDIKDFMRNMH